MTIGAWVGFIFCAILLIGFGILIGACVGGGDTKGCVIGGLIGIILTIFLFMGMFWYYNNTASGARALKSQKSNFTNGIERVVKVYSMDGKVLQKYEGKFDIEYDDDRILFDDENGLRHVIYYPTGTVIIDEVGK